MKIKNNDILIKVKDVKIKFNLGKENVSGIKEYVIKLLKKELFFQEFWALKGVSLEVKKGEVFGILGFNGAGKSTLLKVIAGVLKPTEGKVIIKGKVAPLIELGAGFDMELTARENIYLNGAILGHSKKFLNEKFNEIVEFAELQEFLDVPLKNYSSGMVARIAFAIATIVDPDILIVDEILSVGDYKFQEKCKQKIENMMKKGVTIIIVSHSIQQINELCTRAVLLEKGKIKILDKTEKVVEVYEAK
ncbi:ABC transporter ATP-binding protein [Cetobacterium somerae]|uniref:ABC transporter ATP-binding protein n=1 Tax=Cetobacterium somerae TaxID=188913 RepID=UPI00211DBD9A|nr:ABC transporter ATP-binding protein [Cetobacterium somerae]MCQ9628122.1 ABC transporter ATP-binding protein [Cetobacterium somerae]